ncbi:MAG: tRNA1(Val) (adenine(37)-N6)-methyltransferase [Clostridiales bacterium]|jgi:tRNA1Val (adenine37-N6)-methyltransferase|nr:tRNA1(Val) (adenine(37)-N6)-methyltransferase [Clostridiales bacterium]
MPSEILEGERLEDLQCGGMKLIQNPRYFRFGIDAVLLANFCRVKAGETVIDLCTGTGVIPVLLCAKTRAKHILGIEIQKACADMAGRSVSLNGISDRVSIINGDIRRVRELFPAGSAHVVTANPPYIKKGAGKINESDEISIARHEVRCDWSDIIKSAAWLLKPGGRLYAVHRPERLADIICAAREYRMEPKVIRYVHPYDRKPPILILIEFINGGAAFLKTLPPLTVYEADGGYTDELRKIYGIKQLTGGQSP